MARRQPAVRRIPSAHDWRTTTDEEEVERRRIRAHTERFTIRNLDPRHLRTRHACIDFTPDAQAIEDLLLQHRSQD